MHAARARRSRPRSRTTMSSGSIPTSNVEDETSGPAGDWSGTFRTFREDDRVARPRSFCCDWLGRGGARGRPALAEGCGRVRWLDLSSAPCPWTSMQPSRERQFEVDGVTALTGTHRLTRSPTYLLATRRRLHSLACLRSQLHPVLLIPSRLLQSRALCPPSSAPRALSPVAARTQVVQHDLGNPILRSCAFVAPPDAKCADSVRFTAHPLCIYQMPSPHRAVRTCFVVEIVRSHRPSMPIAALVEPCKTPSPPVPTLELIIALFDPACHPRTSTTFVRMLGGRSWHPGDDALICANAPSTSFDRHARCIHRSSDAVHRLWHHATSAYACTSPTA